MGNLSTFSFSRCSIRFSTLCLDSRSQFREFLILGLPRRVLSDCCAQGLLCSVWNKCLLVGRGLGLVSIYAFTRSICSTRWHPLATATASRGFRLRARLCSARAPLSNVRSGARWFSFSGDAPPPPGALCRRLRRGPARRAPPRAVAWRRAVVVSAAWKSSRTGRE